MDGVDDRVTDVMERQDLFRGPVFGGGLRHAVDDAGLLVLRDGVPAFFLQREQSLRAVATHAGQHDAHAGTSPVRRQAAEEHVDRVVEERGSHTLVEKVGRARSVAEAQDPRS